MSKNDTKNDLNRVGLFSELGYISIGDPYKLPKAAFNEVAHKGKQVLPGGSKERSALQHGYFDKAFNRVMEGEAFTDPVKRRRQERLKEGKKNLGTAFMPSSGEKLPSGVGNHYGTFSGSVDAFSPVSKPRKAYTSPGRNFITNPPKRGTGYGYYNVTIGTSQKYIPDGYDRAKEVRKKELEGSITARKGGPFRLNLHPKAFFDHNPYRTDKLVPLTRTVKKPPEPDRPFKPSHPAKEIGGSKAGCFDPYPSHSEDPYKPKKSKSVVDPNKKIFMPSQGPKSTPTKSTINLNVHRRVNRLNFKQPVSLSV